MKVAHVEKSLVAERASPPPRARAAGKEEAFRVPDDDAEPEHKAKPEGPAEDPPGDDANPAARALGLSPELCAWLLPLGAQTPSPAQEDRLEGSAHDPSGAAPFAVGDPSESGSVLPSQDPDAAAEAQAASPLAAMSEDGPSRDPNAPPPLARLPTAPSAQEASSDLPIQPPDQDQRASSDLVATAAPMGESIVPSFEPSVPAEATAAPPRSADSLTSVRSLTPDASAPDAAAAAEARARLQDAVTSSVHQRTLRDVARGELTVPGLGHVAVTAHASRDLVDVEIRAAQASTAHALHAQAEALAADIRAADITVSRLAFEGAGTWTPSQDPSTAHREGTGDRSRGEPSSPVSTLDRPASRGRVRFVL